jgi:hypothetical protein
MTNQTTSAMRMLLAMGLMAGAVGCGPAEDVPVTDDPTAQACGSADSDDFFKDSEACAEQKPDTGYVTSLDAREMELTIEADVTASSYDLDRAPLEVGQFALTWFREHNDLYIASLAEDYVDGDKQIEWKIGTAWKGWSKLTSSERATAKHFRLTKVNAVLLNATRNGAAAGKTFQATVPVSPGTLMNDVGNKCAEEGHITASRDTYWYVWSPAKAGCTAKVQQAVATVTTLLPKGATVYPEYDKLYADKTLDVVVFFGQVDDEVSDSDYAYTAIASFKRSLVAAGFKAGTATKGQRLTRVKNGITANVDIYSPTEFAGLTDSAHVQNFYDAVKSHEIILYNGHSVLGASDFWANAQIYQNPTKYQIFLYNGCLGYEYYVAPILAGKKSPANVDIVSNVVETPFSIMVQESSAAISLLLAKAENGGTSSWQSILTKMNSIAAQDSFYGVSGARTNTYKPTR